MAYGKEEVSTSAYHKLLRLLPGETDGAGNVRVKTSSQYIGRGEVDILIRRNFWALSMEEAAQQLSKKWPKKNTGKLLEICRAIKGGVTLSSTADLGDVFESYRVGEIEWDELIALTGFDRSIWSGALLDNASPKVMGAGKPTYAGNSQIGPLAGLLSQLRNNGAVWAALQSGNEIAAYADDFVSGDVNAANAALKATREGDTLEGKGDAAIANMLDEGAVEAFLEDNPDATADSISDEQKIHNIKFQTQCLLAANLHEIATFNQQVRSKSAPAYKKTYMLDGEPYKLINKLTYTSGSAAFADITVPQVSSLVPMIRLEKLRYNSKGQYTDSIPIVFDTFTREEDILGANSGGRSGVGIKSFYWDYNGTNIATVKSDITAKLVLFFQTFNDLLAYNHLGFRYVDLLVRSDPPTGQDKSIADPDADKQNIKNVNHDSKYFEIKATVGWAYNNDYILDYQKNRELEQGLRSQRASLFLTLVEHEFDIQQDGTFTLTINYRARLDGMFMEKRADVLLGFDEKAELCRLNEELDEAKSYCDEDRITKTKKLISDSKQKYAFDTSTEIMDQLLKEGRLFYGKLNKQTLIEFDYDVFDIPAGRLELTQKNNKLMELSPDVIATLKEDSIREVAANYGEVHRMRGMATIDAAACEESFVGGLATRTGKLVGLIGSAPAAVIEAVTGYDVDGEIATQDADGQGREIGCFEGGVRQGSWDPDDRTNVVDVSEPPEDGIEARGLHRLPDANGDLMIPYFFLGDLIDIVANKALGPGNAGTEDKCNAYLNPSRNKNMAILLGSINVESIGKSTTGSSNREMLINIGDIPVALEYFRDFWARRVTKPKKTTYSLNNFIKDCLRDFGLRALGEQCFKERPEDLQIKDATITIPAVKNAGILGDPIKDRIFTSKRVEPVRLEGAQFYPLVSSRLNMQHINSTRPIKFADFGKTKVEDTYHYKLFYLQNKSAANMTGMKHKDEKNGIIHLGIGENRGLLKNISFKRANMPGLREQRVVEENAFNPLSHLADVYNIEVSMIGNTIFYPGQYVYVNPLGFGAKLGKPTQPRSPSRAMGLGGYHMITQVSSFIESGKFETTVTALWETSGGPGADRNDRGESTGTQDCVGIQDEATAPDLEIESNIAEGTPE